MRTTTKKLEAIGLVVLVMGILGAVTALAYDEVKVTLKEVPDAVRATILREAGDAKVTEIERETKNGKTTYEAEFVQNGKEIEIKIAPDGTLLGREVEDQDDDENHDGDDGAKDDGDSDDDHGAGSKEMRFNQLPSAAQKAIRALAGDAKITEVEQEKSRGATVYAAEWIVKGVEHEAVVTADGTLVETEVTIAADKAPAAVRATIAKRFGARAKVVVEKKTIVVYEVEGKVNGKELEILIFPTGQTHEEDGHDDDDDHDDHDDDDDDDDHDHDDDDDDD